MLQILCRRKWLLLLNVTQLLLHCIKLRSENREGLHVSIPERMVSCRLLLVHVRERLAVLQVLCRGKWLQLLDVAQLLLHCKKLRSENRGGLHVSIPETMVSCRLLLVHVRKRLACR